jgi:hypothetical protein
MPSAYGDEGMWTLPLLKDQQLAKMKEMGLRLRDCDIYSADSSSLKDAVVIFGSGCTGVVVSPDGLLLTNHHCGYSRIQQHSAPGHDYLTDGYWAAAREDELPNPGLSVTFIESIEDVTQYVAARLEEDPDPDGANFLSPSYLNALARERVKALPGDGPGVEVEIRPFYDGNRYFMFVKKVYTDVRLVGAPPSSIGKFGADTDNWVWPRHTGDFSLFRIYADSLGNPAAYSAANVPLHPRRWMKISTKGVEDDDFVMMMGFPGRTNKYYTSWEVAERRDIDNAIRIHIRRLRQEALLDEMLKDPLVRIQYSGKYASSANAHKNAIGMNRAIGGYDLEKVKRDEQEKLTAWSKANGRHEYVEAIRMIEQLVSDRRSLRYRSLMLDEALIRGIEITGIPLDIEPVVEALSGKDDGKKREQVRLLTMAYNRFFNSSYSQDVDRKVAKVMLAEYLRMVEPHSRPPYFNIIEKKFKGDAGRFVDHLFDHSIYGISDNFSAFVSQPSAKALEQDPMILFAKAIRDEKKAVSDALAVFEADFAAERRIYVGGLLEMFADQGMVSFPDANSTLRLTYGRKKGYAPADAVYHSSQTTLKGVMEKEDPADWEFVVPKRLKELYAAGDFGPYAEEGGMPVAFSATTHTTGGNSGSPVMNAGGELVGLNFDRNWEGVGGDIQYLPDRQRSIIVDIRYVLFIIDIYAGAGYLLKEMDIDAPTYKKDYPGSELEVDKGLDAGALHLYDKEDDGNNYERLHKEG